MKIYRFLTLFPRPFWLSFAGLLYGLLHFFGAMQYAVAHLPGKVPYAVPYHLVFYAGLAALLWLSQKQPSVAKVVLLVMCAGAADEIHQMFLPFRGACVSDVLLDTAAGWLGACCMERLRTRG